MIAADLQRWLDPLERFEAVRRRAVRMSGRIADLSYANPYDGPVRQVRDILRTTLDDERPLDLQYTPFGGSVLARRAVADSLRRSHGVDFRFDDIVLVPGASAALNLAMASLEEPGGEIIIPIPCWLDYPLYVAAHGLTPVLVPHTGAAYELDVDAIDSAISKRTVAVLLSQPSNPTGRLYAPEAMRALAAAMQASPGDTPITLIADETHRDFSRDGDLRSPIHHHPRSLVIYSFGKYHSIQGQRIGYVAVPPAHPERKSVRAELSRWARISGLSTPTALMQRAVPALLALDHPLGWLWDRKATVSERLGAAGYEIVRGEATYFMYVRTPSGWDDEGFMERLASQGILVLPAPVFHHSGYFRISLTGSETMFERAIDVLVAAAAWAPGDPG